MNFTGHPMFPTAPTFTGGVQEGDDRFPLAGSPEEIHPKRIPGVVKDPELFSFGAGIQDIQGTRSRDNYVSGRMIHNHKMVFNCPCNPCVQGSNRFKPLGIIAVLCYFLFKPFESRR